MYTIGRMFRETGLGTPSIAFKYIYSFFAALDRYGSKMSKDIAYREPLSRHRSVMPLYDMVPVIYPQAFVAPNATVIGEVIIGNETQIW